MANPVGNPNIRNIGFGSRPREVDEEIWSRKKTRKWTKEKCIAQLEELMDILKTKIDDNNFKQLEIVINKMMDITKYLYPPVTQSKNLNVNVNQASSADNVQKIWLEVQDERQRNNKTSDSE